MENLISALEEIWRDRVEPNERKIIMYQFCKGKQTIVQRNLEGGLSLCDDQDCVSCVMWRQAISESIEYSQDFDPEMPTLDWGYAVMTLIRKHHEGVNELTLYAGLAALERLKVLFPDRSIASTILVDDFPVILLKHDESFDNAEFEPRQLSNGLPISSLNVRTNKFLWRAQKL